jgi:hypothetical protein
MPFSFQLQKLLMHSLSENLGYEKNLSPCRQNQQEGTSASAKYHADKDLVSHKPGIKC